MSANAVSANPEPSSAFRAPAPHQIPAPAAVNRVDRAQAAPELQQTVARATRFVDSNGDGKLTREEVTGALNFVVGGFFFRTDKNADGKVTPTERRQADFAKDHPEVNTLLGALSKHTAVKRLMTSLDANLDQTLELK
jgi:hypothetical protein